MCCLEEIAEVTFNLSNYSLKKSAEPSAKT
jgi:hypothetical protein